MSTPAASAERLAALPSLTILGPGDVDPATVPHRRLPAWLKRPIPASGGMGAKWVSLRPCSMRTALPTWKRSPNASDRAPTRSTGSGRRWTLVGPEIIAPSLLSFAA